MRTSEAVTSAGGLWFVFAGAVVLYAVLGVVSVLALKTIARRGDEEDGDEGGDVPYGPPSSGEPGAVGAG
jgi:cytochrome bd-type quinol oxidase subunit 1